MADNNTMLSSQELVDAQAHVWSQIFSFINSMCLKCMLQLGIPDVILKHAKPMTLSELVDALPIDNAKSPNVYRLMRILIHSKFFVKVNVSSQDDGLGLEGYWLTPASRLLLGNEPLNVAPFALAMLDPIMTDPFHDLGEWFQNDTPSPYETTHGRVFWEHANQEPRLNHFFNEGMASDARLVSSILVNDCKQVFHGLKSMVDVGGGVGTVARNIANAFPGLKCVVLELPHVVSGLEGNENVTFVVGDMFNSIPPADAVFLKWILHDWNDEDCVRVLKKCREAIPSKENGGKVIVVEIVVDDQKKDEKATETQLLFDMVMMTHIGGRERTEKEWGKLFSDSGFSSYKITTTLLGLRSVIEVFRD